MFIIILSGDKMEDKNKKIEELEARIADLELHKDMWFRAGGMGGRMALQAMEEIDDLKLELEDLKKGTHYSMAAFLEDLIRRQKSMLADANYGKRKWFQELIDANQKELQELRLKNEEIERSLSESNEEKGEQEEKSHSK